MKIWLLKYTDLNEHETIVFSSSKPTKEDRNRGDYRLVKTIEIELPARHGITLDNPFNSIGGERFYD
jgi:hypothetical protein